MCEVRLSSGIVQTYGSHATTWPSSSSLLQDWDTQHMGVCVLCNQNVLYMAVIALLRVG